MQFVIDWIEITTNLHFRNKTSPQAQLTLDSWNLLEHFKFSFMWKTPLPIGHKCVNVSSQCFFLEERYFYNAVLLLSI